MIRSTPRSRSRRLALPRISTIPWYGVSSMYIGSSESSPMALMMLASTLAWGHGF